MILFILKKTTHMCLLTSSGAEQLDDNTDINSTDCRRRKTLFISSFPDLIITPRCFQSPREISSNYFNLDEINRMLIPFIYYLIYSDIKYFKK